MNRKDLISGDSLEKKLIKKGFWLYFFGYLSAPLRYIIRVIISNSPDVSVAEFGILYSIISLITFLYTYNDLGLTESLQYFLPRFYLRKQFDNIKTTIYFSLFIQIITGIIIALGLRFGSDWLAFHYFKSEISSKILKYFCLYFLGMNILQVIQAIFKSFQRTFEFQCIDFIKALSTAILTLSFFLFGCDNIEHYSISRLGGIGIAIIFAIFLYIKYRKNIMIGTFNIDNEILKKYTKYALWALIGNSIRNLFGQIILQMVIYLLGAESAGYYSNFLSLFFIGTSLIGPIILLIFPLTSQYFETSNKKEINHLLSIFYTSFSIIILSLATLFIVLGPELAITLFGEKYIQSGKLLSLTGIFLFFNLLASFNYSVLAGLGKIKERVYITITSCLITIITGYIGIKTGGLYGAGIAFGISNFFNWGLSFKLLNKEEYKLSLNRKFIIKNCIILIGLGIIILIGKNYLTITKTSRINTIYYLITCLIFLIQILGIFNRNTIKKCIKLRIS